MEPENLKTEPLRWMQLSMIVLLHIWVWSIRQRRRVNTIGVRAAGQRDLRVMSESSWPRRHTAASKAGLQRRGGSLRELVKSGLVTVLTTEREGQAGECNKTFHFSLSWTLFLSLCLNTLFLNTPFSFLSNPPLNLPPFVLSLWRPLYPVLMLSQRQCEMPRLAS